MKISKTDPTSERVEIEFEYNPMLIEVVRKIDDRKYDKKRMLWTAPATNVREIVNILVPIGFEVDEEVKKLYNKKKKHAENIKRLKRGDFKEGEEKALRDTGLPLFEYQKQGSAFLAGAGSGLMGDQPGLGKTIQTLATTIIQQTKKVLVFCPAILKSTWSEEIEKWRPDLNVIVIGGTKEQRKKQWASEANYYIVNYELLLRDFKEINAKIWDAIVADEATRLSNPTSKTTHLIKKINSKRRIALTGTPLNNSIEDIWSIVDFCIPGAFGTYYQFTERYCEKDPSRFNAIVGYKNLDELRTRLSTVMIRRRKIDVLLDLPPKLYEDIRVDLSKDERKMYRAVQEEIKSELNLLGIKGQKFLSDALVKMTRLRQVSDSTELLSDNTKSSKLESLKELLEMIVPEHSNDKAIIFTQFKKMALILMRELEDYKPLLIAGGISQEQRDENKKKFNENTENKILIMTDAGAFGLNLQRASYVIHYDLPWSVAKLEQREDRAHRTGQKSNVTVYRMIARDTIDEYVLGKVNSKMKVSNHVLGDTEKDRIRKTRVTSKDIRAMLIAK